MITKRNVFSLAFTAALAAGFALRANRLLREFSQFPPALSAVDEPPKGECGRNQCGSGQ